MSIKTKIIPFLFFLGYGLSFSAPSFSSIYQVSSHLGLYNDNQGDYCGLSVGKYFESNNASSLCSGESWSYKGINYTATNAYVSQGQLKVFDNNAAKNFRAYSVGVYSSSCSSGSQVNPDTGQCEDTPPTCENGQEYNPDSGLCEDPAPYCEQSSTLDSIFSAEQSCAADGGVFSYQCHNGDDLNSPSLETTCNEPPEACVMGFPNWPECLNDYNPTDPIDPPSGGFVNPDSSTGNSPDPSFDKPEPDPVTPTDTTDTALLEAFQNMNRDNNQALGHINEDINKGNADIKNKLDDVRNSTNALGQSIVDQMNQDYQISLQQRQAMTQQNKIIGMAAKGVSDSVMAGSGDVVDAVNLQGTRINDTLNGIADKICDPTLPDTNCEGEHGLSPTTVSNIVFDVADSADSASDIAYGNVVSAAQGFVNDSGTSEIESVINSDIGSFINVFPTAGTCTPFSLPTPQGEVTFDCDFSDNAKTLISFIFYVYTAWSLISIFLSGITPVPAQSSNNKG
ncbi:hypothetical protein [Vibrio rumoiensis]|uniref:hypothetical protein n=1 Tax=Vibrio rumoiensis TaxID=76258 RepID=UPI000B5D01B0|nr:hypothetical protein [Vibrio rumoiensis]